MKRSKAPSRVPILVVDDDPEMRLYYREVLSPHGFEVIAAESGRDALEKARQSPPAVVILDLTMPGFNGFDVLRFLRSDAGTRNLPVLISTGVEGAASVLESASAGLGATDFLRKPFPPDELLARVRRLADMVSTGVSPSDEVLERGRVRVSLSRREVFVSGKPKRLPKAAFELLVALFRTPNGVARPAAAIARLRKALGAPDAVVASGGGYKLVG